MLSRRVRHELTLEIRVDLPTSEVEVKVRVNIQAEAGRKNSSTNG
jgi:hypothetical protein